MDNARPASVRRGAKKRRPLTPLQWIVHLGVWVPLAILIYALLTDNLTVNPIQALEQRTGDIAIILLALSLACTPLNLLLRQPQFILVRRPLGLYAYMYAAIHLTVFTVVDYGLDWQQILQAIREKPFVLVGLLSFIGLSLLAATSFRYWKARLGKNWKRLHQLVYAINLLVVLHFGWSVKGDFFRLRGDIERPLIAFVIIAILLLMRLPAIRRSIAQGQRGPALSLSFRQLRSELRGSKLPPVSGDPAAEKALPRGEKTLD